MGIAICFKYGLLCAYVRFRVKKPVKQILSEQAYLFFGSGFLRYGARKATGKGLRRGGSEFI